MDVSDFEKRLAENELVFRQTNEEVQRGLRELREHAIEDGHASIAVREDIPLYFFCECANERCDKRILLPANTYRDIHQNSSQFVVLPGHNVPEVERIVARTPEYMIVEKNISPSEIDDPTLHPTSL